MSYRYHLTPIPLTPIPLTPIPSYTLYLMIAAGTGLVVVLGGGVVIPALLRTTFIMGNSPALVPITIDVLNAGLTPSTMTGGAAFIIQNWNTK